MAKVADGNARSVPLSRLFVFSLIAFCSLFVVSLFDTTPVISNFETTGIDPTTITILKEGDSSSESANYPDALPSKRSCAPPPRPVDVSDVECSKICEYSLFYFGYSCAFPFFVPDGNDSVNGICSGRWVCSIGL